MVRIRLATIVDIPAIGALMRASIKARFAEVLSPKEAEASAEGIGVDTTLIEDGTYFVAELDDRIVGCGGWGRRKTLYGSSGSALHDDTPIDPANDPARIRAMFTHPDYGRRGVAAKLLLAGEKAAKAAGFQTMILGSTAAGRAFYTKHGYTYVRTDEQMSGSGLTKQTFIMIKPLL